MWLDVIGLADVALIERIGAHFGLHQLSIEDVVRPHQRPKLEDYGEHLFIVARMAPMAGEDTTDQLGMFIVADCILTFQERPEDDLNLVRERIRSNRGRIRRQGADYLAYSILDAVIDAYFPLLEESGEQLEALEDQVISQPRPQVLQQIYDVRRRMLSLRKSIWPLREVISAMLRDDSPRITRETRLFLRDCYDHTVQMIDLLEVYRELSSNLMDVFLSSSGNRMNEVMKVLTMITTIFIPLSFIAGIYGMNFDGDRSPHNMPELRWYWGYPACLGVMLVLALLEVYYFYKKGWFESNSYSSNNRTLRD
jgi:magnesium transporter